MAPQAGRQAGRRINLDLFPAPVVMAGGIGGDNISHYWLEGEPEPMTPAERAAKPPYRIPSMGEIAAQEPCGYTLVSTFSGCGGSCLGFRMAGFRTLWASEFVAAARQVYALNHPDVHLDDRDIRQVQAAEVLEVCRLEPGQLDVLEGSPPCASFSTAGKRDEGWGKVRKYSDTTQRTDDLFFEFARLLGGLRPRVFVAENVSGLVKGVAKGYFKEIHAALAAQGYRVEARVLDAQWLGVPQSRQRLIFMGVRADLPATPVFPRPWPYRYSVREAIADLVGAPFRAEHDTRGQPQYSMGDVTDRPAPTVLQGGAGTFRVIHDTRGAFSKGDVTNYPCPAILVGANAADSRHYRVEEPVAPPGEGDISGTAIARELETLKPGQQSERYFNLVRPHPDRPCPTVTQTGGIKGAASVVHPVERRKFTIAELRRVCGFPDDFQLVGTYAQQWERLGRAVPPPMMRAVAEAVRDHVLPACGPGAA